MPKVLKTTFFFFVIASLFVQFSCQRPSGELPASYYNFPVDTTIEIIQTFPSVVDESSGIIYYNGNVWTHNDSGDDPLIYEMSIESGEILNTIEFENAEARDWEDMTQDDQFIYVSDMGNNAGKRQDLAIYKSDKADILDGNTEANAIKLSVTYPDRVNFRPKAYQHNFDCEAILSLEDSLYIFSKNHLDKHCRFYTAAKNLPNQVLNLKNRFDTQGMVTGAAFNKEANILALLGYNFEPEDESFGPFIWLFWDFPNRNFFSGKSRRINMPIIAQAEGIGYWKEGKFLISLEKSRIMKGKLMVFDAKKWIE